MIKYEHPNESSLILKRILLSTWLHTFNLNPDFNIRDACYRYNKCITKQVYSIPVVNKLFFSRTTILIYNTHMVMTESIQNYNFYFYNMKLID